MRPIAANDNVLISAQPDDQPLFLALGLICAGVAALAVYVVMSGAINVLMVALAR